MILVIAEAVLIVSAIGIILIIRAEDWREAAYQDTKRKRAEAYAIQAWDNTDLRFDPEAMKLLAEASSRAPKKEGSR